MSKRQSSYFLFQLFTFKIQQRLRLNLLFAVTCCCCLYFEAIIMKKKIITIIQKYGTCTLVSRLENTFEKMYSFSQDC
jgi:hypothetical protein